MSRHKVTTAAASVELSMAMCGRFWLEEAWQEVIDIVSSDFQSVGVNELLPVFLFFESFLEEAVKVSNL